MPSRIFQPNKGNLQGIADKVTQDEIRKLWEHVQLRTGQIGDPNERHVTYAELQELARRIPSTDPQSTGFRATTLGGENAPSGEGGGGGGNPIAAYDENALLSADTRSFDFRGAAITATQVGTKTIVTVASSLAGSQGIQFFADATFTVPEGVYLIWVSALAGGGGGGARGLAASGGGGGGSGEVCIDFPIYVTPGQVIPITIGAGGAGATATGVAVTGSSGGDTIFGSFRVKGGLGGTGTSTGGAGGGGRGGVAGGASAVGNVGNVESNAHFGGNGGSGGGSSTVANGAAGVPGPGFNTGALGGVAGGGQAGGGAGAGTLWNGVGGAGGSGGLNGSDAPAASYGAGGGGAGGKVGSISGGRGGSGWCLIAWIGAP